MNALTPLLGALRFNTPGPDLLEGDDGPDTLEGLGGDDTLRGFGGNDSLDGGDGRDRLEGGDGDDTLDASGGSAESQGFGDYIRPGLGNNTILGHEGHWNTGEGADVSYGDLSGIGGLTINIGANGTGTAVSGTPGLVNDTFTFIHYFEGSQDGDLINGSDEDVWFGYAPLGGADTVNGGGGYDELNYSYEIDYFGGTGSGITVNLSAGTVVDTQGNTDVVSGIEEIRGTFFADLMDASGTGDPIKFRGEEGNDTLIGGNADDRLEGNNGDDSIAGGGGRDWLRGGDGNDTLDASGGSAESQGFGDLVRPGLGTDTMIGHAGLWEQGSGINVQYGELSGVGGITINVGPDGTGTAVSGTPGLVNDTFTLANYFNGSMDGDLFNGSDEDRFEGFAPLGGADTINGGGGYDEIAYNFELDNFDGQGSGIIVNWAAGTVIDTQGNTDVFTGIEQIRGTELDDLMDASGTTERVELRGEEGNDTILGGSGDDRLRDDDGDDSVSGGAGDDTILAGRGMDTFDGGEGRDRIELDLRDTAADAFTAIIDLAAGEIYALEFPDNNPDVLLDIEDVRLRGSVNARITGDDADNDLRSDAGNDTLIGGGGRDDLTGGDGDDLLDASGGSTESQGWGDWIRPGFGQDTIVGHEGLWNDGDGIDIGWGDVEGAGGLTITVGAGGTGTAVSGTAGLVNDSFTYAHYFVGSKDSDLITGNDEDRFEGFSGLGGDDTIHGNGGYDEIAYNFEHRWYDDQGSGIFVDWAAGTATDTQGGTDTFSGIEQIRGSVFDDEIDASNMTTGIEARGEDGNDFLIGGEGDDTLDGGAGSDTAGIEVNQGDATIDTGENGETTVTSSKGTDILRGIEEVQFLDGTLILGAPPPETLVGNDGNDALTGNEGDDQIFGLDGDDTLDGAGGDDNIGAGAGNDVVTGGEGNDFLGGGQGDDSVDGGVGNDIAAGGAGNDTVSGGDGDDGVYGGDGSDLMDGGAGNDVMGASFGSDTIDGGDGNDDIGGGTGKDSIDAGAGNDSVGGGEGDDEINGRSGDDFLAGGGRNDNIVGGAGNDTINGGDGDDRMTGGAGADVFVFNFFKDGDDDVITDFSDGEDMILIRLVNPETNEPNIDNGGNGLQGFVDALNITDVAGGAQMNVDGHLVLVQGVSAADLTKDDFIFV